MATEPYITFTQIKDFLFSPTTTYLQEIYREFDDSVYKGEALVVGKQAHQTIEEGRYAASASVLQGKTAYWSEANVGGRIDLYFPGEGGLLVERKWQVNTVYTGDRAQLYAQYFAMCEEEYPIARLAIHSLADNRRFYLEPPGDEERAWILSVIDAMRQLSPETLLAHYGNDPRAVRSIYHALCW